MKWSLRPRSTGKCSASIGSMVDCCPGFLELAWEKALCAAVEELGVWPDLIRMDPDAWGDFLIGHGIPCTHPRIDFCGIPIVLDRSACGIEMSFPNYGICVGE